jgi:hypothetical protein
MEYELNTPFTYYEATSTIVDCNGMYFLECHKDDVNEILKRLNGFEELEQQLTESQASNDRLNNALNNITQDYYAEVQAKYSDDDLKYPSMQKSKDSDMTYINEAMDLLRETPK